MEEIKNIPLTDEEIKDWPHPGVVKLGPPFTDPRGIIQKQALFAQTIIIKQTGITVTLFLEK